MTRPIYITLSSIPPRFPYLGPILQSLVDQQGASAPVLLYIPQSYRRFPDWDGRLPDVPSGVTIVRIDEDYGPATKVLPALRQFAGQDVGILFCDDDNHYPVDWLARFIEVMAEQPNAVVAMHGADLQSLVAVERPKDRLPRAEYWNMHDLGVYLAQSPAPLPLDRPTFRSSGYMDTLLGRGGVLVRPVFFTEEVFTLPAVIWAVDDFWLSGHLETNGVPIWVDHRIPNPRTDRCMHLIRPLLYDVIENHDRWDANGACVDWFRQEKGIWHPGAPPEISRGMRKGREILREQKAQRKARPKRRRAPFWKRLARRLFGKRPA